MRQSRSVSSLPEPMETAIGRAANRHRQLPFHRHRRDHHDQAEESAGEALVLERKNSDLIRVAEQLLGLSEYVAQRGDGRHAAQLGGVAYAIGELIGDDLRGTDETDLVATGKNLLGDEFAATWEARRAVTPADARAEALGTVAVGAGQAESGPQTSCLRCCSFLLDPFGNHPHGFVRDA